MRTPATGSAAAAASARQPVSGDQFYSPQEVSPDIESRLRKKKNPAISTASSMQHQYPSKDSYYPSKPPPPPPPRNYKFPACALFLLLLALCLGIAFGTSIRQQKSAQGDESSTGSVALTQAPSVSDCENQILPFFPINAPIDFTVRMSIADLCVNYPELDCYSLPPSFTSLNGAQLFPNNLWYFTDLVVLRVRPVRGGNFEIRLEVVHAHDSESRAFVYTFIVRARDYCFVSFSVKQLVLLDSTATDYCVYNMAGETRETAGKMSQLVARFAQRPTAFVERIQDRWVVATPRTDAKFVTTTGKDNAQFLMAVRTTDNNRPPAFLVMEQNTDTHFNVMAALENDYVVVTSTAQAPQCRTLPSPLASRSSLVFQDESVDQANHATACSTECQDNGGALADVVDCINSCLVVAAAQDNEQEEIAVSSNTQRRNRRRRLSPFVSTVEDPMFKLRRTLAEEEGDDDALLACSRNQSTATNVQANNYLVTSLLNLQTEVKRLETSLAELIPLWNLAANHHWNFIEANKLVYFDALDMRDRFLAALNQIRTLKSNSQMAEIKDLAEAIYADFSFKYSPWFTYWDKYFNMVGGSVGLQALNSVHLSSELLQLRRMLAALEVYLIPIFSTTSDDGNIANVAYEAAVLVAQATQQFAQVELDFFNIQQIANSAEVEQAQIALTELAKESLELVSVLDIPVSSRLESALRIKIQQSFSVSSNALHNEVFITQQTCQQIMLACNNARASCRNVNANLAQELSQFDSAKCSPREEALQLCNNKDCAPMGNSVFVPTVSMQSRKVELAELMQDITSAEQFAPILLHALQDWPDFPTPQSHLILLSRITNSEEILKRVIATYSPEQWLPASCFADALAVRHVMMCPELAPVTLALRLCEVSTGNPTVPVNTQQPTGSAKPTKLVTVKPTSKAPSKLPTKQPTAEPTQQPTLAPTLPTLEPTEAPVLPTYQPSMSPVTPFSCVWPSRGCATIFAESACDGYTGCTWDSGSGKCNTISDCDEFDCKIKLIAYVHGGRQLPGCRLGNAEQCDIQRFRMFDTLKLGSKCGQVFVRVNQGGAWMGKEVSLPLLPASDNNQVFVSSAMGDDNSGMGTRAKPYLTVARAVKHTRAFTSTKRITILPGVYRIPAPILFTPQDNGLSIVGEGTPRLAGTVALEDKVVWEKWGNQGIIRAKLPSEILPQIDTLSQLFVNEEIAVRARFPNLQNHLGFNYNIASSTVKKWVTMASIPKPERVISKTIIPSDVTDPSMLQYYSRSILYNKYSMGYGGMCSHFTSKASYFCDPDHDAQGGCTYSLPIGVIMKSAMFKTYASAFSAQSRNTPYFHTLHWWGWGLWTFSVSAMTQDKITFGKGGWQEARGDCARGGGDWYLENMKELLDFPNEYFVDLDEGYLYFYPPSNEVNPILSDTVKIELGTKLRTVFRFSGTSPETPIRNITVRGIDFFGTYPTLMDEHEVPGGGDWTLTRQATVEFEHCEDCRIQDSRFRKIGGNALLVSKHAKRISVERNDFYAVGSTAVVIAGDPAFNDVDPWVIKHYPEHVRVYGNVMSYFGLTVKQAAGVFVALSKHVDIEENVVHTSPRGGLVLNDGFGGAVRWARNTVFDHVLETNDHGIINSWDRQQFVEPAGWKPEFVIEDNLLLGTAKGPKGIDLDDGVFNYISRNNVLVWGYQKFKGSHIRAYGNLILYPLESSCVFITPQTRFPAHWDYSNNVCVAKKLAPYEYNMAPVEITNACLAINFNSANNTFYIGGKGSIPKFDGCTPGKPYTFDTWQTRNGQDAGSTLIPSLPRAAEVEQWVYDKLAWIAINK